MLDAQTTPWIILGGGILIFLLLYLRSFFTWIGGSWYEKKDGNSPIQEIHLKQFGPFVWGNAKVNGGELVFRGWFNGKQLTMKRKDYGRSYFTRLGFPDSVINTLDGSEMAKMSFELDNAKGELMGQHFPQKIEISRTKPPKVLERGYLPPLKRKWVRHQQKLQSNHQ